MENQRLVSFMPAYQTGCLYNMRWMLEMTGAGFESRNFGEVSTILQNQAVSSDEASDA